MWEIDALVEGRMLAQLDERDRLTELALNVRYAMSAKKVKPDKMFNKKKEESKIRSAFTGEKAVNVADDKKRKFAELTNYFMKKGEK